MKYNKIGTYLVFLSFFFIAIFSFTGSVNADYDYDLELDYSGFFDESYYGLSDTDYYRDFVYYGFMNNQELIFTSQGNTIMMLDIYNGGNRVNIPLISSFSTDDNADTIFYIALSSNGLKGAYVYSNDSDSSIKLGTFNNMYGVAIFDGGELNSSVEDISDFCVTNEYIIYGHDDGNYYNLSSYCYSTDITVSTVLETYPNQIINYMNNVYISHSDSLSTYTNISRINPLTLNVEDNIVLSDYEYSYIQGCRIGSDHYIVTMTSGFDYGSNFIVLDSDLDIVDQLHFSSNLENLFGSNDCVFSSNSNDGNTYFFKFDGTEIFSIDYEIGLYFLLSNDICVKDTTAYQSRDLRFYDIEVSEIYIPDDPDDDEDTDVGFDKQAFSPNLNSTVRFNYEIYLIEGNWLDVYMTFDAPDGEDFIDPVYFYGESGNNWIDIYFDGDNYADGTWYINVSYVYDDSAVTNGVYSYVVNSATTEDYEIIALDNYYVGNILRFDVLAPVDELIKIRLYKEGFNDYIYEWTDTGDGSFNTYESTDYITNFDIGSYKLRVSDEDNNIVANDSFNILLIDLQFTYTMNIDLLTGSNDVVNEYRSTEGVRVFGANNLLSSSQYIVIRKNNGGYYRHKWISENNPYSVVFNDFEEGTYYIHISIDSTNYSMYNDEKLYFVVYDDNSDVPGVTDPEYEGFDYDIMIGISICLIIGTFAAFMGAGAMGWMGGFFGSMVLFSRPEIGFMNFIPESVGILVLVVGIIIAFILFFSQR